MIAHEYPGTLPKLVAYGLASTVSFSRIRARQHFPSDVLVGSILGYLVAQSIYTRRHEPGLNGGAWESPREFIEDDRGRSPAFMSSPAVPLDSWIYPALERLAAMGYIDTAYVGMRPWTRLECARLVGEAVEKMPPDELDNNSAQALYRALSEEFAAETARRSGAANEGISLDSIYTRMTGISGPPLRDGYHFGQTITNDYGRPYGEGFNNVSGMSGHAVAGPLSFDVRAEYQHAPAIPGYQSPGASGNRQRGSDHTRSQRSRNDRSTSCHRCFRGPGPQQCPDLIRQTELMAGTGSLGFALAEQQRRLCDDDENRERLPFKIPLLSKVLGPMRAEYFLGQLAGAQFELNGSTLLGPGNIKPQPALSGYKASFKPTTDFEFGMGITAQFVGPGLPFTWRNFLRTFYVHNQTGPTANNANPGKRISSLDFSYRVPGIRKWLTIYGDSLVVDEISPIGSKRATVNPGIYMPQFPRLPKLEFRAEGINEPITREFAPGFVYYGQRRYRSGYTNEGNLMGNWIGRAGHGGQAWMTYSISPRNQVQLGYRLQQVSKDFIGGGRSVDLSVQTDFMLSSRVALSAFVQHEQWTFPVLSAVAQSNTTASVRLVFYPHWSIRK